MEVVIIVLVVIMFIVITLGFLGLLGLMPFLCYKLTIKLGFDSTLGKTIAIILGLVFRIWAVLGYTIILLLKKDEQH